MPLPLILDIALGLVLIYLLLSLLASEIQELIATVLQWRAEHLKKSIEILVTGSTKDVPGNRRFVNNLYRHPLIQALNHQAKGRWISIRQRLYQPIERLYRSITKSAGIFPEHDTGPSYIPANVFAIALLKMLRVEELAHKYSELFLRDLNTEKLQLIDDVLIDLRNSTGDHSLLLRECDHLKKQISELTTAFIHQRSPFTEAQARSIDQMVQFVSNVERHLGTDDSCKAIICKRLPYLRQFLQTTHPEPTIADVVHLLTDEDYYDRLPPELMEIVLHSISTESDYYAQIDMGLREGLARLREDQAGLPPQLRDNLRILAEQAEHRAQDLATGLEHLQAEIETWFNRSMDRASGVYKRNAKGVAILIGIAIAIAVNADTFHIMARLSRDSVLRDALRDAAVQTATPSQSASPSEFPSPSVPSLDAVEANLDQALTDLPLPIGWDPVNVQQQRLDSRGWHPPILRRILSWIITGIAISMGASFWYGALSRVAPLRNTGKPADSGTSQEW